MNKESHAMIGKILWARLKDDYGIYLDQEAFLAGNVLPDFGIRFLIKPHVFKNYGRQVKDRIQRVLEAQNSSAIIGKSCSSQLGIICHYYADFFCHMHNGGYSADVAAHVRYEKDLCRYLSGMTAFTKEKPPDLFVPDEVDADTVYERLIAMSASYLKAQPSFLNDITMCVAACMEALVLITGVITAEQANNYGEAIAIKA